ncbi:DUF2939 domain-containing protein [Paucibacter sp. R3-3]|uniref:DUF2939 domain-containing protein n=1 Tax=Roseateles agri TaxID=3098619 RepID=A0ABU5DER6_9BURK|nr:DUF2939 domain-containing protein [Paucibacter sp. R3-3]MDY0743652.1 DUF2939 domain-containing protein [Paucibacter sp. R3-3]
MKLKTILALLAALLLVAFFGSPWLAVHEMRAAARAHDAAKLGTYVDFEKLRESLKRGVQAKLLGSERNEQGEPSAARAFGAAVAGALLGPMVDVAITPESLARLLQGQRPAQAAVGGVVAPKSEEPLVPPEALETHFGYEGLNRFIFSVKKKDSDDEPVDLVFHRDGLFGWKLAELRLP